MLTVLGREVKLPTRFADKANSQQCRRHSSHHTLLGTHVTKALGGDIDVCQLGQCLPGQWTGDIDGGEAGGDVHYVGAHIGARHPPLEPSFDSLDAGS